MQILQLNLSSKSQEKTEADTDSKQVLKNRKFGSLSKLSITPKCLKNESFDLSFFSRKSFSTTSHSIQESNKSFSFPISITFSNEKCSIKTCSQKDVTKSCESHSFCSKHQPKYKNSCSLCKCSRCSNYNVTINRCGIKLCFNCKENFGCCIWCCGEIDKLGGQAEINTRTEVNSAGFKRPEQKSLFCYVCKQSNIHSPSDKEICDKCYFSLSKGVSNHPCLMIYRCCECKESKIDFEVDFASEMRKKKAEELKCMICQSARNSIEELKKFECGHRACFECILSKCDLCSEILCDICWINRTMCFDFIGSSKMSWNNNICEKCAESSNKCSEAFCGLCMKEIKFKNTDSEDLCFECYKNNASCNAILLKKCVKCTNNIENDLGLCERCFFVDQYGSCEYEICQNCFRNSWSILITDCLNSICKICLNLNENKYCCLICFYFLISSSNCKHKSIEDFKMAKGYQKCSSYLRCSKDFLNFNYSGLSHPNFDSVQKKFAEVNESKRDELIFDFNENKFDKNVKDNCCICNSSKECALQNCGHIVCPKDKIKSTCKTCYKQKCSICNKSNLPKLSSNCKNHIFCTQCFKRSCSLCPTESKLNPITSPKNIFNEPKIKAKHQYNFKSFSKLETIKHELNNRIKSLKDIASNFAEKSFELINWMSKEIEEKMKNIQNTITEYQKLLVLVQQGEITDEHERIISSHFKPLNSLEPQDIKNIFSRKLFVIEEKYWSGNHRILDSSENYIVMELRNNMIRFVDIESKNHFIHYQHSDKINSTQIFDNEKLFFTSSSDGSIIKWDLSRKFYKKYLIKENKSIINFNISSNLATLIYITEDLEIKAYDLISCKQIEMITINESIEKSAISANLNTLIYTTGTSLIKFYLDSKAKFSARKKNFDIVNQIFMDEKSKRILCLTENSIELMNFSDLSSILSFNFESNQSFIGFVGLNNLFEFDFEGSIIFLRDFMLNEETKLELNNTQKSNILWLIGQKFSIKLTQEDLILY